ncbi:hypothetical protein HANVADRAFT_53296 [Hanseniaspora valbyensis NRRL Y-1626]|uniref:Tricalbin n=1 Tax=Hanseniaspora valbyensis NRRL Y-1626 TaxID=766949 RepID=A0A1B7TBY9_9ASCO|nr:hypothetical protein HANVADRAFT_53296 [Hanseniaspora valbyensis NRRL Y-1626]
MSNKDSTTASSTRSAVKDTVKSKDSILGSDETKDVFVASSVLNKKNNPEIFNGKSEHEGIPIEELKPSLTAPVLKDRATNLVDSSIPKTNKNEFLANVDEENLGALIDSNLQKENEENNTEDKFLNRLIKELSSKPEYQFKLETFGKFVPPGEGVAFTTNKGKNATKPTQIKDYIEEFFYNDYYSNISLMLFTCLWSYFVARWGASYFFLLVIWFFTASTYKKSMRRLNRNLRDDIKRIQINETLSDKTETINWLNQFLAKFWVIYMPVLSQQVKDAVNPALEDVTPGYGIDALTLDEFTLGTKAPTIDTIKSYTKKGKDIIEMDWKISFTPNDTSNMTSNEIKRKVNPKIALGITVGKSFVSKSLPVLVENINVAAHAKVSIQLNDNFPNIKIVSISLLEHLLIDFALKPVGGDTLGLDIMSFLPGLKTFVTTMIDSAVGPMLYAPNKLDIDVEEIMENAVNDALGCVAITVEDYKPNEVSINNALSKKHPLNLDYSYLTLKTSAPTFNNVSNEHYLDLKANAPGSKTVFIPINSLDQELSLNVSSYHEDLTPEQVAKRRKNIKNKKSHTIGGFKISLSDLEDISQGESYSSPSTTKKLYKHGKKIEGEPVYGTLIYKVHWLPIDPKKSTATTSSGGAGKSEHKTAEYVINGSTGGEGDEEDEEEGEGEEQEENGNVKKFVGFTGNGKKASSNLAKNGPGILKITLQDATDLFVNVSPFGQLNPSAVLSVDDKRVHTFRKLKRINEPSWNELIEVLIPSKKSSLVKLQIFDSQFGSEILLGEYTGTVSDYLSRWLSDNTTFNGIVPTSLTTDFPSAANTHPKIRAKGIWKPLAVDSSVVNSLFLSEEKDNSLSGKLDSIAKVNYIGGLRVYLKSCVLKSSDLSGVGDIDPYVSISFSNHIKYKTHYFPDNKKPIFDSVCWIPVKNENETCILSVYDYQNVGKDRFFGSCDFNVAKYIKRDSAGNILPYLKSDQLINLKLKGTHGDTKQSTITISISFVPVEKIFTPTEMPLVKFWENKLQESKEQLQKEQEKYKEDMKKNPDDYEVVPLSESSNDNIFVKNLTSKKIMPINDIVSKNSGVLSMELNNFKINGRYHLQVVLDDSVYPSIVTYTAKEGVIPKTVGSGFVRDLSHSRIGFRLTTKATITSPDHVVEEWFVSTRDLLVNSSTGTGASVQSPKKGASFNFKSFLFPTTQSLPSTENVFDTGELELEIINATNLPSHDRNGKSDPFAQLMVNSVNAYETKIIKKTLDPTWNETAKVYIPSRSRSNFTILVYDWDRLGGNDLLSTAVFPLNELNLDKSVQNWELQLAPKGVIYLRSTFVPKYVTPPLSFDASGIAGVPLKALSDVAGFGVGAAGAGVGAGLDVANGVAGLGVSGLSKGTNFLRKGLGGGKKESAAAKEVNGSTRKNTVSSKASSTQLSRTSGPTQKRIASLSSQSEQQPTGRPSYDASVPNQSYAQVPSNSLSHDKASQSVVTKQLLPDHPYNGTITVVSSDSLGPATQLRISLNYGNGKINQIHKTDTRRADKNGESFFGDVIPFKASKNAIILVEGYGKHTFGKDTELGFSQISLSDPQILENGQTLLRIGNGTVILDIQYGM